MHFSTLVSVLAIAQSAFAAVYITNPVSSTKAVGGQVITVNWGECCPYLWVWF
jgi:hypothetical protein